MYKLHLKAPRGERESLVAIEVLVICVPMYRLEVPRDMLGAFGKLNFAEDYHEGRQVSILRHLDL